jgi:hypothetical protein
MMATARTGERRPRSTIGQLFYVPPVPRRDQPEGRDVATVSG